MFAGGWSHDLRLAARGLWRARAFTTAAVLTMALGIGGTTVMFALIQGVLLRPRPVHEPDRLIVAWKDLRSGQFSRFPFGTDEIEVIGRESRLFERVAGVSRQGANPGVVFENGEPSYVSTTTVTGTFFATLGVRPILGRALEPADDVAGAEKVLVITHGLWQRRYGGSADVIGRRLVILEGPFTIVGVMPPDFADPRGVEGWMTVEALASLAAPFGDAIRQENELIARLRPGVTREQALRELQGLVARLEAAAQPGFARGYQPVVGSYDDVMVGDVRPALFVLFAAVGLVLLISSANVANLLLLRGESRQGELAVRAALGASPYRMARALLAESLLLALAAGLVALVVSRWVLRLVVALVPDGLPRVESVRVDLAVALFTVAIAFAAAVLAGLAPAFFAARTDLVSQLRTGRQPGSAGARRGRRVLVAAQVALAVTVVAAAGLLTRSLLRLQHVDLGLTSDRLVFVSLSVPRAMVVAPEKHRLFLDDLIGRLEGAPGIDHAAPVNTLPFSGANGWDSPRFAAEGQSPEQAARNPSLNLEAVDPGHFATLGVTVLRGRAFSDADRRKGAPAVAIVSEDVAARTWPGEDPIGKRLKMGAAETNQPWQEWRTVVGVVKATRYRDLVETRPTLYLPATQFIDAAQNVVLRTRLPVAAVAGLTRERVRDADPNVRVVNVQPLRDLLAAPLARPRFNAFLIATFGVTALLLAGIGLYAVMAAHVRQRYAEIGIRLALGATAADVRRLVLGEGLRLASVGALAGLAAAVAASRALRGLLFDVQPLDASSLLGAAALLVAASALACYLPARRAVRVDPVVALRS